jgi:hypothetical protein
MQRSGGGSLVAAHIPPPRISEGKMMAASQAKSNQAHKNGG